MTSNDPVALCVPLDLLAGWARNMFGSMSSQAHQAHIALSELMTSKVLQGSNLGSCPTFPALNPHFKPTFGSFDLVSSPVWWEAETNIDPLAPGLAVNYLPSSNSYLNKDLVSNPTWWEARINITRYSTRWLWSLGPKEPSPRSLLACRTNFSASCLSRHMRGMRTESSYFCTCRMWVSIQA